MKSMPKVIIAVGMLLISLGKYVDLDSVIVGVATILSWILTILTNYFEAKILNVGIQNEHLKLTLALERNRLGKDQ